MLGFWRSFAVILLLSILPDPASAQFRGSFGRDGGFDRSERRDDEDRRRDDDRDRDDDDRDRDEDRDGDDDRRGDWGRGGFGRGGFGPPGGGFGPPGGFGDGGRGGFGPAGGFGQGGGGPPGGFRPAPEMFFDRLDRDGDGRLEREELEGTSEFFRGMLDRAGVREGPSRDDFARGFERMREERDRDSDDDDEDRRRDGDDRGGSRSGPSYYKPAERPRVTIDLPDGLSERDFDADGQIGLHEWREWDRGRAAEFFWLDRNGDGFLTPREFAAESGDDWDEDDARSDRSPAPAAQASGSLDEQDPEVRRARQYFGLLDRNGDGSVNPDEWSASRRLRPAFEEAGLPLDRDMPADDFVRNYVRVLDE